MRRLLTIGLIVMLACGNWTVVHGQEKTTIDTLECSIIGFSAGIMMPGWGTSSVTTGGNMRDLYAGPYLDFALEYDYKYKSGWMITAEGDLWFGMTNDNLKDREIRLGDILTPNGQAMAFNGVDGLVAANNRTLAARVGLAKIINVLPKNPDSGILLKLSGGWLMQKTVFWQDMSESAVPQLRGDYAKLYDHLRHGAVLTQSVGFTYMSNYITYINVKIELSVSESVMWSTRPYQIDNLMGLNGKDNNTYFDMFYGLKLTWMFPLMGKTTYDYYYY